MSTKIVKVSASTDYDILIGKGLLKDCGKLIAAVKPTCKIFLITDDIVDGLYGEIVEKSLSYRGFSVTKKVIPNGEQSKSMEMLGEILESMTQCQITRDDIIVALGGGVVGDISGFAAAVYQRGIEYVQIPTTFLAQIDSSVGGKTAVNLIAGKNLVGAFKQPLRVIIDTDTLATLGTERFGDGVAEAIKYSVIASEPLFESFETAKFTPFDPSIPDVIEQCVTIKREFVTRDEFDRGDRQQLNFGHTVGHGIEKCSDFSLTHGYAVAIGMQVITHGAAKCGLVEDGDIPCRIKAALAMQGLPYKTDFGVDQLFEGICLDKKRTKDKINIILPMEIGRCKIHAVELDTLRKIISCGLEE